MSTCIPALSYIILRAFWIPQANFSFATADCLALLKPGWRHRHNCSCTVFLPRHPPPVMLIYTGKLFIQAHSLLRGAHKTLGAAAAWRSPSVRRNMPPQTALLRVFPTIPSIPVRSLWFFVMRLVHPLSLFFQEALASSDVRAVHGLSHDPMPVQDEFNRYVFLRLSVIYGRKCDAWKCQTFLDETKQSKKIVTFYDDDAKCVF